MKIYISGPISGLPFEDVKRNFDDAQMRLEEQGYEVINPLNNGLTEKHSWKEHMKADIKMLMDCDEIYMMKGYAESKGAMIEYNLAQDLGYDITIQIE